MFEAILLLVRASIICTIQFYLRHLISSAALFTSVISSICLVGDNLKQFHMPGLGSGGGGGTPYSGLYGEAPPERDTFFSLKVYKRVGISQVEVNKRVGILAI